MEQSAISQQELDETTFREQSIEAQLRAAEARLLELENGTRAEQIAAQRAVVAQLQAELNGIDIRLAKSSLRAPYTGVIADRHVDEGSVITAGTPVLRLLETGRLDVRIGVSEDALPQLGRGSRHAVTVNDVEYPVVVRGVRPDRNQQTRTVSVLFALDAGDTRIHIGDLATLRIDRRVDEPGFWVPVSSLTASHRGLWSCYVAVPDATSEGTHDAVCILEQRELEVLHQTADAAFVRGSLQAGEALVINGIQRLVPGQRVRRLPD